MTTGAQSRIDGEGESTRSSRPSITVCESCPGKVVFLESDNTDGWIATDLAVEPTR